MGVRSLHLGLVNHRGLLQTVPLEGLEAMKNGGVLAAKTVIFVVAVSLWKSFDSGHERTGTLTTPSCAERFASSIQIKTMPSCARRRIEIEALAVIQQRMAYHGLSPSAGWSRVIGRSLNTRRSRSS